MRLTHLSKYAAIAGALAAPLALAAPASATGGGTGSAYGLAASGLVPIPATPAVSSSTQPSRKSLFELPPNPLISLKVLHVAATPGHARASVVDLKIVKAALRASLVTAKCDNGMGSSHLAKVSLGGRKLAVEAAPNSSIAIPVTGLGTVSVTINKQVHNSDGTLTVTALELKLPLGPTNGETVSISSATCSGAPSTEPPGGGEAPTPSPVPSDLPVTG